MAVEKSPRQKPYPNLIRRGPGRPKGVPNKATCDMRDLARMWTAQDPEWVASARKRMKEGTAPHLEKYLLEMGYGQPAKVVEVRGLESVAAMLNTALDEEQHDGDLVH